MYHNNVTLIGFLGSDAEVRTNNDRSLTTLSLATKSSYKKDGKYIEHTEWHRCVVFRQARRVRSHAQEGRPYPGRGRAAQPQVREQEDQLGANQLGDPYENEHGTNIYVSANPICPGSRKRKKENIASVRHLYVDIDTDGDARLARLRSSDLVPIPTAILSTSPGKYQVLWRVQGFDFDSQEETLKLLAQAFGGDPACTDRNRVLRLPGFLNQKYSPAHRIAVEYPADATYTPADFRLDSIAASSVLPLGGNERKSPATKHSHSEEDWAWVCDQLAHGHDPAKLTRELALHRADKPDPLYYAQRTVDVASARLWLAQGVPFADVVTMLEVRRRFEFPAVIARARAQEIAATAERMITRQKTA